MGAGLLACSTLEYDDYDENPAPPPGIEYNGFFISCEPVDDPTTGYIGAPQITCVDREAFGDKQQPCTDGIQPMHDLYFKAICANTYGGTPDDYETPSNWVTKVDWWPLPGYEHNPFCDVTYDFDQIFDNWPFIKNEVLMSTGSYNGCSHESYCETLTEIASEYPGAAEPDPFHCNINPSGDPDEIGPWICVGSATSACGYYYPDVNAEPLCPYTEYGEKDFCVLSTEEKAAKDCASECQSISDKYAFNYSLLVYPEEGYINCGVFATPAEMLWASDPDSQCSNPIKPAASSTLLPFSFSATLQTAGGNHADTSTPNTFGLIGFTVDNCGSGHCDITISSLTLPYTDYSGNFFDNADNTYPYAAAGVTLELLTPISGIITQHLASPWTVAFPAQILHASLRAVDLSLDGTSVGPINSVIRNIPSITGTYNSAGALALDIEYETIDATVSLSLVSD